MNLVDPPAGQVRGVRNFRRRYSEPNTLGVTVVRRMASAAFRAEQVRDIYASHIRAINELVDELSDKDGRGWLPHVAPFHGGVNARVLSLLRDPGPKTQTKSGSGFLCTENDDQTAERHTALFDSLGVSQLEFLPWNAYPWYINRAPSTTELRAGTEPLLRLIALLPKLQVVLLQGGDATKAWTLLERAQPSLVADRQLEVIETIHPSRQALRHIDPHIREARERRRTEAYTRVAEVLRD